MKRFNKIANIFQEYHMVAICSHCGESETDSSSREDFIKWLRSIGWSIGKQVLCTKCKG